MLAPPLAQTVLATGTLRHSACYQGEGDHIVWREVAFTRWLAGSCVGARNDYLGMIVDVSVTSQ
jgi:hypothetical protein